MYKLNKSISELRLVGAVAELVNIRLINLGLKGRCLCFSRLELCNLQETIKEVFWLWFDLFFKVFI